MVIDNFGFKINTISRVQKFSIAIPSSDSGKLAFSEIANIGKCGAGMQNLAILVNNNK